ncbi:MAG: hypothetical protein D6753_02395 [Planctomycetota bacterium]|nr:MAG: hypothetical protein D6753_02395 [Planctomycetota bacterium]
MADAGGRRVALGRLQIVLAGVLWSSSGFFAKAPWFDGWPIEDRGLCLAFWRSAFAALVLVPLIRRPAWYWQLVPMVACFALMVWTFMTAMVYGPAANAIWLQYLAPAWVTVAAVLWMKEPMTRADGRMIVCCLAGVIWILVMEWVHAPADGSGAGQAPAHHPLFATAMGILSGISFAGVVLCIRSMRSADPVWLITLNHGGTALLLLPWVLQAEGTIAPLGYLALGMFGVLQMSLPYVLFARGLQTTPSPEASVLTLIEPILVPLWGFLAWRGHPSYDAPGWWVWVGAGLILAGLITRYAPPLIASWRLARYGPERSETRSVE